MKVIFLDIDGVLNANEDFFRPDGSKIGAGAPWVEGYMGISQPRVRRLRRIVEETGAVIVLVSSWKECYEGATQDGERGMQDEFSLHIKKYLINALRRQHLRIFDTTLYFELLGPWYRGDGIRRWIENWNANHPEDKVDSFVILDDEEFDYEEKKLSSRLVLTEYYGRPGGLTDEKASEAIKILRGENHGSSAGPKGKS